MNGRCAVEDYEPRWKRELGMQIGTLVYVRKLMDEMMRSDPMMTAVTNMITPAHTRRSSGGRCLMCVLGMLKGMQRRMG